MALFSSVSMQCFLESTINVLPDDAYPITHEQHNAYMLGQGNNKVIDFSTEPPRLIDPPSPSLEQLAIYERAWRDDELVSSDTLVARHRDERDMGFDTTLTAAQFTELMQYRQRLREWPESGSFPSVGERPVAPEWLIV